jgi:glucose-6-phosphate 1-epimerase
MTAEKLAAEFGIRGALDFVGVGDLVKAVVSLDGMQGELFLQGATVTRWQPAGERPVIFTSPNAIFAPGTAVRGGIPIIFPWFGPKRDEPKAPQHGFVRAAPWQLERAETSRPGEVTLSLSIEPAQPMSPFWPELFRAVYTVSFGKTLSVSLAVQNRAGHEIVFEEALHTYFAVSDIAKVSVSGLAGTTYIDKVDGARRKTQDAAPIKLSGETDRVYLGTPRQVAIEDPEWRRRIVIEKDGAASTVVWNPWNEKAAAMKDLGADAWVSMICVETGNAADNEVRLAAGGEHRLSTRIAVDAIK